MKENRRKTYFFSALIVAFSTLILLVTGSSVLVLSLDKNNSIPLGTLITWAGLISLPLAIYWGVKELREPTKVLTMILSIFLKIIILLGILWVPISYLLAGNLAFTFAEKDAFQGGEAAMKWFWRLSYGIGVGSCLSILIYWTTLFFNRK